jgi:long-chain acyl-CoA synthetase
MSHWNLPAKFKHVEETHFGLRRMRCFAERPASFYAMFEHSVARFPAREAVVCGGERLSYAQLDAQVTSASAGLSAQGIRAGERVVLMLPNGVPFIVAFLAVLRMGAIAVPVSMREQAAGLAYVLNQCQAACVVLDAQELPRLSSAWQGGAAPSVRVSVVVDGTPGSTAFNATSAHNATVAAEATPVAQGAATTSPTAATKVIDWHKLLNTPTPSVTTIATQEEDTAILLYTSGTTGHPKGAMLANLNIVHSIMHFEVCMALSEQDRSLLAVPASHVTGVIAIIATQLAVGGCIVIMPEFKADSLLEVAARERVTHTIMVPAMYKLALMQPTVPALPAWRVGGYGGAPMSVALIDELAAQWPNLNLINAYGATETTSPTTCMPTGATRDHADTVGVAVPCADIKVVDDSGQPAPAGVTGELLIAGPMVVPGYWDNPQANASAFTDGYWHSGDLGSVDAQGFVRIFDRKKDMINRGGYKVFSVEVENAMLAVAGVVEAAVVGVPCPVLGERVHAFAHTSAPVDADAILAALRTRLADYKVPESMTFSDTPLPRNANGKLLKRALRERLVNRLADAR